MKTRLSHAYCPACDVYYRANNAACTRCHSRLDQTPPAANTVMRNAPNRPPYITVNNTNDSRR